MVSSLKNGAYFPLEFNPSSPTQKLNQGKGEDDALRRQSLPLAHTGE